VSYWSCIDKEFKEIEDRSNCSWLAWLHN